MSKKSKPENARASPLRKRKYSLSTELINGGERVAFEISPVVVKVEKIAEHEKSEDSSESDDEKPTEDNETKKRRIEVSIMLILQILTIFVAIIL